MLRLTGIIGFILSIGFLVTMTGCHHSKGVVKKEPDSKVAVQKQPDSKVSTPKQADSKVTAPKQPDSKASVHPKPDSEVIVHPSPAYEKSQPESPPWAPSPKDRTKYLYYYYPDFYVYFDVLRGLYFLYQDDKWQVQLGPPRKIELSTEYVILEMTTDMPYQFHSDVINWFPPGYLKSLPKKK
jgi:hypothetical protein